MFGHRQQRKQRHKREQRKGLGRRTVVNLLRTGLWVGAVLALCLLAIALRMSSGALPAPMLAEPIARALTDRLSPGWQARIAATELSFTAHGPALLARDIDIRQPDGAVFLRAQEAEIAIDAWRLPFGDIDPTSISFSGIDARLTMMPDGSIGLSAEEVPQPDPQPPAQPTSLENVIISIAGLISDRSGLARALDRISVTGAELTIIDIRGDERARFRNLSAEIARQAGDTFALNASLQGASEPWRVTGSITTPRTADFKTVDPEDASPQNAARSVSLAIHGAPLTDVLLLAGAMEPPLSGDLPLSAQLNVEISDQGRLTALSGHLEASPGRVIYHDPDQPPFDVEVFRVDIRKADDSQDLLIPALALHSNGARFALAGKLAFGPSLTDWRLTLAGGDAILPGLTASEPALAVDRISLAAAGQDGGGARIERLEASGAEFGVALNGAFGGPGNEGGIQLGVQTARSSARAILHFWPAFVTPEPRQFLIKNLSGGVLEQLDVAVSLSKEQLQASRRREPLPAETVRTRFSAVDATLAIAPGFPALENMTISGLITGADGEITASQATAQISEGQVLRLSNGHMTLPRLTSPINAAITFNLAGPAPALAGLLRSEALRPIFNVDIDPASLQGETNLDVRIDVPLVHDLRADMVAATASGRLTKLAMDLGSGKERLSDADLALTLDASNLALAGKGQISGLPAIINLRQPVRKPGEAQAKTPAQAEANVVLTLDDAARAKRGFDLGKRLRGPLSVRLTTALAQGTQKDMPPIGVDIDLAQARIDNLLPGWVKAAGKPGKLAFTARANNGFDLTDIALDAGASARGSARIGSGGTLENAQLTQVKLSPNDDISLAVENTNGVYSARMKGNLLDARPLLKMLTGDSSAGESTASSRLDLDADAAINIVAGFNSENLSKASLKLSMRKGKVTGLQTGGSFSGDSLRLQLADSGDAIMLETADAGSILRFADIYRYMAGGNMRLRLPLDNGVGKVTIHDFAIHDEPTMRRILTETPRKFQVDPSNVPFSRMQVDFSRAPGRINVHEGVLWGPGVGVTIEGNIDTANEQMDLSGTYVPAYALNNIFSQVPIIGRLLGGGQNEGLFAVNFRARGAIDSPNLTINPLSAIAPGIFRKFFDLGPADSGRMPAPAAPPKEPPAQPSAPMPLR